jgi:short-subunit dehydrogenase
LTPIASALDDAKISRRLTRAPGRFGESPLLRMKLDNCTALVTGASAGIGREIARQLTGRARTLVLVARREQRLLELRDELTKRHPNLKVHIRVTDLADKDQIDQLVDWLAQEKIEIDFLINNAGLGDLGPFATSDPERVERIMQVNMLALTSLTRRLLPAMIAGQRGAILNVSSSAGFLPIPHFSLYAATKAFVTSFSEALRAELRGNGVSVCALCPGPVHTEFTDVAHRPDQPPVESGTELFYTSAETVARAGLAGIENDRPLIIPGFAMKVAMFLVRIAPRPVLRLASALSRKRV